MRKLFTIAAGALLLAASPQIMAQQRENPFLKPYDTKYGIPPFDKIEVSDFIPAIKAGVAEQEENLRNITRNRAVPDFDNTILPLENLSPILERVQGVFYHYGRRSPLPSSPRCRRRPYRCSTKLPTR